MTILSRSDHRLNIVFRRLINGHPTLCEKLHEALDNLGIADVIYPLLLCDVFSKRDLRLVKMPSGNVNLRGSTPWGLCALCLGRHPISCFS